TSSEREARMDNLRILPGQRAPRVIPCCRCAGAERNWDRIAGKPYCPECQEALVLGLAVPLTEKTEKSPCAACGRIGTVRYLTFPLHSGNSIEMDLCPDHLRGLLGRHLRPYAFHQLRRKLDTLGIAVESIFLLHEAFYDENGRA